jgi:hypothetical protein
LGEGSIWQGKCVAVPTTLKCHTRYSDHFKLLWLASKLLDNGIIGNNFCVLYITLQVAMLRAFLKCDFSFLDLEF